MANSVARTITFVTSNEGKLREIQRLLRWPIVSKAIDLPEIQGSPTEIATAKCKAAVAIVNGQTLVEDSALCFDALGGMPGPYIKWFTGAIGDAGVAQMLTAYTDAIGAANAATAMTVLAYTDGIGEPIHTFVGQIKGTIVSPPRGNGGFGWDTIFRPHGYDKTFGEMTPEEKDKLSHRSRACKLLNDFIDQP